MVRFRFLILGKKIGIKNRLLNDDSDFSAEKYYDGRVLPTLRESCGDCDLYFRCHIGSGGHSDQSSEWWH